MKKGLSVTMTAALAVSALTPAAAFAAETPATAAKPGLYNIATGQFYSASDFKALTKEAQKAIIGDTNFFLVSGGKVYKGLDVITATQENLAKVATPEATFEAEKNITLTPEGTVLDKDGVVITPEPGIPGDVVVESVMAINDVTVDSSSNEKQMVGFTINDGKEVSIADLKASGYTVEFKSSSAVFKSDTSAKTTSKTGELDNSALSGDFKYQVEISKDDEVVATSALATVKAEDFSAVVTNITKVVPVVDGQEKASNTVIEGDTVEFEVYGNLKNNPEKEVKVTSKVDSVKSSKPTTLYVSDKTATAVTAGTATITVKAGDVEATQEITVSAEEAVADKLTADLSSVDVVKDNNKTIKITVKNQYGDIVPEGSTVSATSDKTSVATVNTSDNTDAKGVAEFTVNGVAKGTATITFTVGDKTLEVPVNVAEAGEVATKNLKGDTEFDIADSATHNLTLQGYDEAGLESGTTVALPTSGTTKYKVKSSDKNVATAAISGNNVEITGKKAGTVTVTLEKYEGALTTPTETYTQELTISDSRAKLTGATLVKDSELPEFTSTDGTTVEITKELSEVIEKLSFLPGTTAYELEQGEDGTVINIVDVNDEVSNNVLGSIEVKSVGTSDTTAAIVPSGDNDATITLSVTNVEATQTGAVIVNVKDADGNIVQDVALDINILGTDAVEPEVTVALPEEGFVVGTPGEFTITTKANNKEDTMVIGNSSHDFDDVIETLEYWDGTDFQVFEGDFGPSEGFKLADATSKFRVTFKEAAAGNSYTFTTNIVDVETDKVLAEKEATFNVSAPAED